MLIELHDVGHGQCVVITAPNGKRLMVDCGTRFREGRCWWPSIRHLGEEIDVLTLLNLDEDHIRDFGSVMERCKVRSVISNPTIGPIEFQKLKSKDMGPGAKDYLKWLNAPRVATPSHANDWGGVVCQTFWNLYGGPCDTTNDLSLAFFVRFGNFTILFAGDLEAKGWEGMMANPEFRTWAATVKVYVASHHGRTNGCCEALFKIMHPDLVIISDDYKQHETQETDDWYRQRTKGITLINDPSARRYVLTTRNDGAMKINANADGSFHIEWRVPVVDWPIKLPDAIDSLLSPATNFLAPQNYLGAAADLFKPVNELTGIAALDLLGRK
jgi:beta-lactamase superfamily II metal-dependent hydrolase